MSDPACLSCGHGRLSHIYGEGPCRPGFMCPCPEFRVVTSPAVDYEALPPYIDAAAEVMAEATSFFVLHQYAKEGLAALLAAGWKLTPPDTPADYEALYHQAREALAELLAAAEDSPRMAMSWRTFQAFRAAAVLAAALPPKEDAT